MKTRTVKKGLLFVLLMSLVAMPMPGVAAQGEKKLGRPDARGAARITRLQDHPQGQQVLNSLAQEMAKNSINVTLLAGKDYLVNQCLGIRASAGTFRLRLESPKAWFGPGGEAFLRFHVQRISMSALKVRVRPNTTNALNPCGFSKGFEVGGSASDVVYQIAFTPRAVNWETCAIPTILGPQHMWTIGGLNLKPLQNDLDKVAKEMIQAALTVASNMAFSPDRITGTLNGLLSTMCGAVMK